MADGIRAGSLFWDLDVAQQEEALRKVDAFARRLDEALNKPRATTSIFDRTGQAAEGATTKVTRLADQFARLKAEYELGQSSSADYRNGLTQLQTQLQATARSTDQNSQNYRRLGTTMGQTTRELNRLSREQAGAAREATKLATEQRKVADREVRDRVQSLVNQVRVLRNEWQETGQGTQETKDRLRDLMAEMSTMRGELREGEDGWERYNAQIARLAVAGRSAEATIMGMEGKMSRLGLASQVNLGLVGAFQGQLSRFGIVGQMAGQQLGIVAGGFGEIKGITPGAALGIGAVGAAAAALLHRGIPEVKEMQTALRVLVASGENLDQAGLDETLRRIQDEAGLAGQQFRRAEVATALAEIVKAGVDATSAMDLLAPGMQLAAVTGQSLNETTTLLLGNLRQFGLTTKDAARLADSLAAADLAAAHGAKELSEGLAVIGPVAAAAGFELEDVLGILVELDNKGMNPANVGATALRATLTSLLDPTAKAKDTLAGLGVEITNGDGTRRPLLTVLHELRDALQGNEEAAFAAAEIFDTRAVTAIINMTEESDSLADALRDSHGAMEGYADTMLRENLVAAQNSLNAALSNLALTFAGTFASDIVRATQALAGWLRQVEDVAKADSFWAVMGALDPNYKNFEQMTTGQQFRTILFGGTLEDRLVGITNTAEALAVIDAELARLQERLESPWTLAGHAGIQDAINKAEELRATYVKATEAKDDLLEGGDVGDTEPPPAVLGPSMDSLIARARELKAELDAATDPAAWIKVTAEVDEFRISSDEAALAWQAVLATLAGGKGKGKAPRTVDQIFSELEEKGLQVREAVAALGGDIEDELWGLEQRAKLVDAAMKELLARPDINEGDNPDRLAYLVRRGEELNAQIERAKRGLAVLEAPQGGIAGVRDGDMSIAGVTIPGGKPDPAEEARRLAQIRAWQQAQAAVDAYGQTIADLDTRITLGLVRPQDEANERLKANEQLLRAMVPLYDTLTQEQLAYVQGIIGDSKDIQREIEELRRQAARQEAAQAHAARLQDLDGPSSITSRFRTPAELRAWVQEQRAAARDLEDAARAAETQASARLLSMRRDDVTLRLQARAIGHEVTDALTEGTLEGLQELETRVLEKLADIGDDPAAAPFIGLLTQVRAGISAVEAAAETALADLERRQRQNLANAMRVELEAQYQDLGRRSVAAMRAGSVDALRQLEQEIVGMLQEIGDDPSAAPLMGLLTGVRAEIQNLTTAADQASFEGLQRRIIALRNAGFEPTSEAVQELVRQINELQLKAALEELRTKGLKNLSAFARSILQLNGLLPKTVEEATRLSDRLRGLNDAAATGFADVLDGIRRIGEAGGDTTEIIEGLTQAMNGARAMLDSFADGDAFEIVRSMAMMFGEGLSMIPGMPSGLGALAGGIFDLGRSIVQAISDAFTGDSPAARAIREGLTPAVQSAFANGILAALQSGEDWHGALRENLKLAFLTSLINAFVQSAIIGPIMQPIFTEYSKMVARGQFDAAGEFLASTLPGAIEKGISAAERFMSHIPASLRPTITPPPSPSGAGDGALTPGLFDLPTAAVTGIAAPEWARDLVNAGRLQLDAAKSFAAAVELLQTEGILVRTEATVTQAGGSGAAATARAV